MDRILTYTVTPQEAGMQVLEFLRSKGFSRHILTSMKPDKEALLVNGMRAGGTKHPQRRRPFPGARHGNRQHGRDRSCSPAP